ncbi:hypothetical protein B0H14DRAFT_3516151 [Mycena olivaceomarginata]|nr:hypothetical protein B0H14DRAFT_3516151 [Mycena olivaceomarginata]
MNGHRPAGAFHALFLYCSVSPLTSLPLPYVGWHLYTAPESRLCLQLKAPRRCLPHTRVLRACYPRHAAQDPAAAVRLHAHGAYPSAVRTPRTCRAHTTTAKNPHSPHAPSSLHFPSLPLLTRPFTSPSAFLVQLTSVLPSHPPSLITPMSRCKRARKRWRTHSRSLSLPHQVRAGSASFDDRDTWWIVSQRVILHAPPSTLRPLSRPSLLLHPSYPLARSVALSALPPRPFTRYPTRAGVSTRLKFTALLNTPRCTLRPSTLHVSADSRTLRPNQAQLSPTKFSCPPARYLTSRAPSRQASRISPRAKPK